MSCAEVLSLMAPLWASASQPGRFEASASEMLSVVTGLACVWLTVRQHPACWPVGIVNNVFLSIVCAQDRLYALLFLQQVYILLGLYGWWHWRFGGEGESPLEVSRTARGTWAILALAAPVAWWGLARGLVWAAAALSQDPPVFVVWDSGTTVACLIAQWMLTRKLIETWPLWIATNVSYVFLYGAQDRFLLAATQLAFIALSVQGWLAWRKGAASVV